MNEYVAIALGAFSTFLNGYLLYLISTHRAAEEKYKEGVEKELVRLRDKCDDLGQDVQVTRGALDWLCGSLGQVRPNYGRPGGD